MVYNFNLGIGWASSGVEYAQAYRGNILRRAGIDAKFIFTDMFPRENIQHMTENIGFQDSEIIWLYTFFTDTRIAPVTYTLGQLQNTFGNQNFTFEREGKKAKYSFPGSGIYYTVYMVDGRSDRVHVAYGYGLFTGGLGLHDGAAYLGATVIPMSSGNTKKQITLMEDFGATALACTPSYAMHLAEAVVEAGRVPHIKLKAAICGAEPWTDAMRDTLEQMLNIKAYDIYGLSEIMGPGVAQDCPYHKGLHIWEDHFIPEILNPDTLEPVGSGERGELAITTVTKEALPLFRYRTKDLTSIDYTTCECGRTHARIARFTGRTDDMLIIRGVNVFPSQVEAALLEVDEVLPNYLMTVDRQGNLDTLEIQVEVEERFFSDQMNQLQSLTRKIEHVIKQASGIAAQVKLVEPKSIERSEGKAKRVIDNRKL